MKNFSSYFFITVHFIRILHFSTTNPLHSCKPLQIYRIPSIPMGLDSSVGIATRYGMDGLGIESRWGGGEIFRTRPDRPWDPSSLLYDGYRVFFPVAKRHPPSLLEPRSKKEQSYTSLLPLASMACYRVNPTFNLPSIPSSL